MVEAVKQQLVRSERHDGRIDLERYKRALAGESLEQIADTDGIGMTIARRSVKQGQLMWEADLQMRVKAEKLNGMLEIEQGRKVLRKQFLPELASRLEILLDGKRLIVETIKETGEKKFHEITDPDLIVKGVELLQSLISMEEKPAQNQTTVNVTQNSVESLNVGAGASSFEERLERIRSAQAGVVAAPRLEAPVPAGVIEAEAEVIEEDIATQVFGPPDQDGLEGEWKF